MYLISIMLIACLLITFLSGCSQSGQKIAIFKYTSNDTFIYEMMEYMISRIPEDLEYEVFDAANSQSVQNQQIGESLENDFDLLAINAVDRLACSSIIARCASEDMPVIFFNREPPEDAILGHNAYYVGIDADSQGQKQAEMVAELFGGDFMGSKFDRNNDGIVQLVIIKGEQGHQDAEKRTDNCIVRLKELGYEVEVMAIEVADWNRRDGYEVMKNLYALYGESIELVFSNNDDMALGAIDYLLEARIFFERQSGYYDQPFVIVGVDGTAVGLDAIGRGLLYGTVNNDSEKQADAILALADYILNDRDFADFPFTIKRNHYIYFDDATITLENLSEYIE